MTAGVVVGLDLSLTATGLAVAGQGEIHFVYRIRTAGKKGDDLLARQRRLKDIMSAVLDEVVAQQPELVVVEAPSYGSQHGAQHDRSGLWWLVVETIIDLGIPLATVSPNGRAKYGTGKGNAAKAAVKAAVIGRYLNVEIHDDNEADAVLLAAMGSRHLGHPIEDFLDDAHLAAMDGAYWPAQVAA